MFDKLVESTNQKAKGRNKFYLVTSLIYGTALSALAVLTIIWFNPGMAEANSVVRLLTPPPVPAPAPPPDLSPAPKTIPNPGFIEPKLIPPKIADPKTVPPLPASNRNVIVGAPDFGSTNGSNVPSTLNSDGGNNNAPPPPPTPTPAPTATPTPAPTPKPPEIVRMTSEMVTGKAIRKVQPPYPQIARQIKAQGTVPVQITISEEGRVLQAIVVGGNPTLHEAARQAALQWVFSPTVLNGKAVKVSGVISFNFILN